MFNGDITEINIVYTNYFYRNKIKIFGSKFVEKNKNICKIRVDNMEYVIKEYFEYFYDKKDDQNKIKNELDIIYL